MRISIALAILLTLTSPACAHRLLYDHRVDGSELRVEAYYDDDTPAQQARVTISLEGTTVAEGRTDDRGVWICPKPPPGTYTVRIEGVGHATEGPLEIADHPVPAPEADDRTARTSTPWRRIGLGVGIIAGVTILGYVLRKRSPQP
jgi:nickel transport protein